MSQPYRALAVDLSQVSVSETNKPESTNGKIQENHNQKSNAINRANEEQKIPQA